MYKTFNEILMIDHRKVFAGIMRRLVGGNKEKYLNDLINQKQS